MSDLDDVRLVYIAGYGRSGSTLLDIMLNQHDEMTSVGALHNFPDWEPLDGECACGQALSQCDFWSPVLEQLATHDRRLTEQGGMLENQLTIERRTAVWRLLLGRQAREAVDSYREFQAPLLESIVSVAGTATIVDSSKSAGHAFGRPLAFRRYLGLDVRIIHLVREPRGVLRSVLSGSGSGTKASNTPPRTVLMLKTAFQWSFTNALCVFILRGDDVVRISYEDLVSRPRQTLERVSRTIGHDLSDIVGAIESGESLSPGHNLGGNRLKRQRSIVVNTASVTASGPQGWLERSFAVLTWPAAIMLRRSVR